MNDLESKSQSSVESANLEQKSPTSASRDSFYNTKQIMFQGRPCTICLQNKNGPCPLLSIINVLSLAGKIRMDHRRKISIESMCDAIGNLLLESVNANPGNLEIHSPSNLEKILSDTMSILPKLQVGLDVNVRFDRINGFEYTPELEIFDMLGINLVHGWLVDPQDDEAYAIVSTLSYNQVSTRTFL